MKDLATDLVDHPELIPYEGTMGGTMRFFGINHTYFLKNGWVIAYFEDGHNSGHMLLRYEVLNNGEIKWKVLHADMSR